MNWHQTYQLPDVELIEIIERWQLAQSQVSTTVSGQPSESGTVIISTTSVSGVDDITTDIMPISLGKGYLFIITIMINDHLPEKNTKILRLTASFKNIQGVLTQIGYTDILELGDPALNAIHAALTINQSASNIAIELTGLTGLDIDWGCKIYKEVL
ncbi:unnamed protein product [marine sediment metagenome]|uniref:Uncharacterized protein n=1 Tax=marine sediment metagenome TaxID=412755 RepID=X0XMD2_9ZZZZ